MSINLNQQAPQRGLLVHLFSIMQSVFYLFNVRLLPMTSYTVKRRVVIPILLEVCPDNYHNLSVLYRNFIKIMADPVLNAYNQF